MSFDFKNKLNSVIILFTQYSSYVIVQCSNLIDFKVPESISVKTDLKDTIKCLNLLVLTNL